MNKLFIVTIRAMVAGRNETDVKENLPVIDLDTDECNVQIKKATECLEGWKKAYPYSTIAAKVSEKTCLKWIEGIKNEEEKL